MKNKVLPYVLEVVREYYGPWETYKVDHPTNAVYEAKLFIRLMTEALDRAEKLEK